LFEAYVLSKYLNEPKKIEFDRYQCTVDALNLAYFGVETDVANVWTESLRRHVKPQLDVFRESLFAMPGYQAHFAASTLRRRSALGMDQEQEWQWKL
jgi:hypothetical protein